MRVQLIRIGNSRGVRIPKAFLETAGLTEEVEMTVEESAVVLRASKNRPREGWAQAFDRMHHEGDDQPLDVLVSTDFDEAEWQWP